MIIEQNDVELLSIKMKSPLPGDSAINAYSDRAKQSHPFPNRPRSKISQENDPEHDDDAGEDGDDHYESAVRLLTIDKTANGACGFHLTRTKWDPYPWVSAVDSFTPAEKFGLRAGDCVLEVNGCDVLGLRITEIAKLVKSSQHQVTLLLWSSRCNSDCSEESLCAAPMPRSLQRLSAVVQCVLSVLECPVCLDTITPPAMQCQNGHLLCVNCRVRAENCPVCRDRYYPRPALIAEQLQTAITSAFNLCRNEDKVRQKIFGRHNRQRQMVKTTLEAAALRRQVHKSWATSTMTTVPDNGGVALETKTTPVIAVEGGGGGGLGVGECHGKHNADMAHKRNKTSRACNKLLTKLLNFKTYSMENLTNNNSAPPMAVTTTDTTGTAITSGRTLPPGGLPAGVAEQYCHERQTHRPQLNTNQLEDIVATNVARPEQLSFSSTRTMTTPRHPIVVDHDLNINSNPDCCKQMLNNRITHFSLSSSDLTAMNVTAATTSRRTKAATNAGGVGPLESPSAIAILNNSSPIWFQRRPHPKDYQYIVQSIPRALKPQPNEAVAIESSLSSKTCHHGDMDADADDDDGDATSCITSNDSTPSTMSLKSSRSSSTSYSELRTNPVAPSS